MGGVEELESLGVGAQEVGRAQLQVGEAQPDLAAVPVTRERQGHPMVGRLREVLRVMRQQERRGGRIESLQGRAEVGVPARQVIDPGDREWPVVGLAEPTDP